MRRVSMALLVIGAAACSVEYPNGALRCDTAADCPPGDWVCVPSASAPANVCVRRSAFDGDAGPPVDAAPFDAAVLDAEGVDATTPDAGPPGPTRGWTFGGGALDVVTDLAIDDLGNVFVTGSISGNAVALGSGEAASTDGDAAYLAKHGRDGTLQWAAVIDGPSFARFEAVSVDGGRVFAAARLAGPASLRTFRSEGPTFDVTDGTVLLSFAPDGSPTGDTILRAPMGVDPADLVSDSEKVCVVGQFGGDLSRDALVLMSGGMGRDGFVLCLDHDFRHIGLDVFGGAGDDVPAAAALDGNVVYVVAEDSLDSTLYRIVFDSDGTPLAVDTARVGDASAIDARAVAVSGVGVFVGGAYQGSLFDLPVAGVSRSAFVLETSKDLMETFVGIVSYGDVGGRAGSVFEDLAIGPGAALYAAGAYGGSSADVSASLGARDPFVAGVDDGVTTWFTWPVAPPALDPEADGAVAIALDPWGNPWIAGVFGSDIENSSTSITLCGTMLVTLGFTDGFVTPVVCDEP